MSHKYTLSRLTALPLQPAEFIYTAAMCGYDYASLRPIRMGLAGEPIYTAAQKPLLFEQLKRAVTDTGVSVYDIELARIFDGVDIADYESAMVMGKSLGAKVVICSIWTDNKPYYTQKFAQLCDLAAKYELYVGLEFVTFAALNTLKAAKELFAEVNRPNATHMIDTLHFSRSRVDVNELDEISAEQFKLAHICDGPSKIPAIDDKDALIHTARGARYYVGEGGIDIAAIISKLPKDVVIGIELPHIERCAEFGFAEHARRCITTAKEYFAKHGI